MINKKRHTSPPSEVIDTLNKFYQTNAVPNNIDFDLKKEILENNISLLFPNRENLEKRKFDYKSTDLYNNLCLFKDKYSLNKKNCILNALEIKILEIQDHLIEYPDNLKSLSLDEQNIILAWADKIRDLADEVILGDSPPISKLSIGDNSDFPSERWPANKLPKENAEAFFRRVWFDCAVTRGSLTRQRLAEIEPDFMNTLGSTFSKRGGPPGDLAKWWAVRERTGPKPNKNNILLKFHGIKEPKDAFKIHTLTKKEQKRLYEAARYRDKQTSN